MPFLGHIITTQSAPSIPWPSPVSEPNQPPSAHVGLFQWLHCPVLKLPLYKSGCALLITYLFPLPLFYKYPLCLLSIPAVPTSQMSFRAVPHPDAFCPILVGSFELLKAFPSVCISVLLTMTSHSKFGRYKGAGRDAIGLGILFCLQRAHITQL